MKKVITAITATLLIGSVTLYGGNDRKKQPYASDASQASQLYKTECGACHMAYQPEFLPQRSWKKMMRNLADHFKTDATLDKEESGQILAYLLRNAADSKPVYGDVGKIGKRIDPKTTPLRISETPYFKKEHRKIPKRLIKQKKVRSIANCTACHTKAESGDYSERNIFIPNYGKWDD
jgi:mono/diheme cytochrome c family protein